jgi:hypothetical protein
VLRFATSARGQPRPAAAKLGHPWPTIYKWRAQRFMALALRFVDLTLLPQRFVALVPGYAAPKICGSGTGPMICGCGTGGMLASPTICGSGTRGTLAQRFVDLRARDRWGISDAGLAGFGSDISIKSTSAVSMRCLKVGGLFHASGPRSDNFMSNDRSFIRNCGGIGEMLSQGGAKRYLIISFGPPASGKGYITNLLRTELGLTNSNTIESNVDDVVAHDPGYIQDLKQAKCVDEFRRFQDIRDVQLKPVIERCSKVYFDHRELANKQNNQNIERAFREQKNLIFETTGGDISWTVSNLIPQAKRGNYTIILFYPLATPDTILKRLLSRAQQEGRAPAPSDVLALIPKSNANFPQLAKWADVVYVYNNEASPKLLFKLVKSTECKLTSADEKLYDSKFSPTLDFIRTHCPPSSTPLKGGSSTLRPASRVQPARTAGMTRWPQPPWKTAPLSRHKLEQPPIVYAATPELLTKSGGLFARNPSGLRYRRPNRSYFPFSSHH